MRERSELSSRFRDDGVVHLSSALDRRTLELAQNAFQWSLDNPSPSACRFYENDPGEFYQDLCNPRAHSAYRALLETSPIADIVAELWGAADVWFLYEQVFLKEGSSTRRTPWHQDLSYLALSGEQIATVWINFDSLPREDALEFVRGSHRATLYDGSAFDDADDTVPIYNRDLPRLPDIEAHRSQFDIISWDISPGDIIVFHPAVLHGGAPTHGERRRTLSLRYFGEDAVYAARPGPAPAPVTAGLHESLKPGDPFRHPAFPKLRPHPSGFDAIPNLAEGYGPTLKDQIQNRSGG